MRTICSIAVLSFGLFATTAMGADPKAPAFTDPQEAGIDFQLQGEYLGEVQGENSEKQKIGVQIIALGDGKFRAVGLIGGLPGEGWTRDHERHETDGERENDVVRFSAGEISAELKSGMLTISSNGNRIAECAKVLRQSPTLGAKPPAGALVLFDGTSADQFENGKIVEGNLLGATNCASKKKFGDHSLHVEFRTPFMPKSSGQGRGNSGVYVQGRYEVQVLDSFGLEGKNNECGGIYSVSEPAVNMCFPPLSWQTYDIDFTAARYDESGKKTANARITVKHNGVVIHDNVELPKGTPGFHPEGAEPDSLFLQDHGNPVAFRNIWVVEKKTTGK